MYRTIPSAILFNIQFQVTDYSSFTSDKWSLQEADASNILKKIRKQPLTAKDVFEYISQGIVSVGDDLFIMNGTIIGNRFKGFSEQLGKEVELEAEIMKPILKGEDVKKYASLSPQHFVVYPHYEKNGKTVPISEEDLKSDFPLTYNYFLPYKEDLIKKKIKYKTNPTYWYSLHRSREVSLFEQVKIVTPETSLGGNLTLDGTGFYHNTQVYSLVKKSDLLIDNNFLLALLNSSLFWFYLQSTGAVLRGGYFRFKTKYLEPFPIPKLVSKDQQQPFIERAQAIISQKAELNKIQKQFVELIQDKYGIKKISNKLQRWHLLETSNFLTELAKARVNLSLSDEVKWTNHFKEQKAQTLKLKSLIEKLNKEINQLVYLLYELNEEEMEIIDKLLVNELD